MKIAIFTDCFIPQVNGIVTSLFNLAKGLSDSGHRVIIVAPKYRGEIDEFEYPNVRVLRIPSVPATFYPEYRITLPFDLRIFAILKKEGIDVVHFETPFTVSLVGIAIAKLLDKPIVGTFHTFIADPQYLRHGFPTGKKVQAIAWSYCNFYYNRCDLVTTPSAFTRRELIEHGCTRDIKVISNGIDVSAFDNSKAAEFRAKHDLKGPVLLFVGRMAHEKNVKYLIETLIPVFKAHPDAKLLLVGDGPQFGDIRQFIEARDLARHVLMLGNVENSSLKQSGVFGVADLFLTASETENQPMAILEAQANGIPCVGVAAKGIPDLILDGVNGLVVPVQDKAAFTQAVLKLLEGREPRDSLRAGTYREIKHHATDEVMAAWGSTYAELKTCKAKAGIQLARD